MEERPLQLLYPRAEDLLRIPKESLAPALLKLAFQQRQNAGFVPSAVSEFVTNQGYPGHLRQAVDTHLTRAWNWIERQGWIEPSPGINGKNGWRMHSEEGEAIAHGADLDASRLAQQLPKALLHEAVTTRCEKLFWSGHYAEAAEMSFKVVRDRLRLLTGYERGGDAFSRGKLYVRGAIAPHVDDDFNSGVKYLTMAIDMFRNEKTHTSEVGINDPSKALQYLILSSLAMRLLDNAEISDANKAG